MNKISKIFILILLIILALITTVNGAENSYIMELNASKTEVTEGEEFYITIEIDPTNFEGGIGAYMAEIKYDSNIFEITNLEGLGNWDTPIINEGKIIATTNDGECVTTKQEIARITFVAKADIINTTSEIVVENFQGSNAATIETAENKTVEIGVKQDENNQDQNQGQENTTPEQGNNTNKEDDTLANLFLPFTGATASIILPIVVLILLVIILIVAIYKKRKLKK